MTREDLAKDILIAFIPQWPDIAANLTPTDDPIAILAKHSVQLADALLEALGAKEASAPWLSKEMRTPAKGFPAIKEITSGMRVVLRAKEPSLLAPWDGMRGTAGFRNKAVCPLWAVCMDDGNELMVLESMLEPAE